jgi:adenylate cyclase
LLPIGSSSSEGWCIYVAGQREEGESLGKVFLEKNERKGDLRFARLVAEFVTSIREARRLQAQQDEMNQFFSPTVVETLSRTIDIDEILDPREQDISVLFCDVRGFSRRAERERHALHDLLNRVSDALGVMTKVIVKYEGVIADFQGDAALAFWGWPQTLDDGPISACRAALEMLRQFRLANQDRSSPLAGFQVGIGIGHGRAIAGKIGSAEQSKVGVFGPVVNLASRLEGMTKQFRVPILMDETTADYVRHLLPAAVARTRRLGRVRPMGMDDSVMVSELLPPQAEDDSVLDELLKVHEIAVETFHKGHWTQAYDLLEETPVSNRAKEALAIYMAENDYSPPDDWDGVIELKSK